MRKIQLATNEVITQKHFYLFNFGFDNAMYDAFKLRQTLKF